MAATQMTLRVALHHETRYAYDRSVAVGPQVIRLRPAPHCRTPIRSFSLRVRPEGHFLNWQQDPHGNFLARVVFPEPVDHLHVDVDLVADMAVLNPFDFFLEESAHDYPFRYEAWLAQELSPYLKKARPGPELRRWLEGVSREPRPTVNFLFDLNHRLFEDLEYVVRMEP
jgi:transglutaminase-like putative cysteine protease